MPLLSKVSSFFRNCVQRDKIERNLDDELRAHLELLTEQKIQEGMSALEARRAARIEFGGVEQVKEQVRAAWAGAWFESLLQDVLFGGCMLARNAGSTVAMAALLSLGIGATTAVFTVFDAVLLRPLPVRHPEELVRMVQRRPRMGTVSSFPLTYYEALRDHATTLTNVFGETGDYRRFAMTDPTPTEEVIVHAVTPDFFDALGVQALRGRVLTAADEKEDYGIPPAVLSYSFWRRRFDGDPQVMGRTIALLGHRFVIVGVMPREVNGLSTDTAPDIRIPLRAYPLLFVNFNKDEELQFELAGRLKLGFTRAQAEAECLSMWNSTMGAYLRDVEKAAPQTISALLSQGMALDSLEQGVSIVRDRFGSVLKLLMASVTVLLLIACSNIAGLQLARGAGRRQEMAVRLALGATWSRVVRQMLAENFLLMALGAAGGLLIAVVATPLAVRALPPMRDLSSALIPISMDVRMNGRVFLFSLALSLVTLLLFGLTPAITASRTSLDSILRGARSTGGWRGRQALIVCQIALCTFLLTAAILLVQTFEQLRGVNPGFDREHVATFTADTTAAGYTPKTEDAFLQLLTGRVRQIPGVVSVAIASIGVMRQRGFAATVAPTGQRATRTAFLNSDLNTVTPEYFDTMGIRLLSGRLLTSADSVSRPDVDPHGKRVKAVVNQAFAQHFFPNTNALGKFFGNGMEVEVGLDFEIVGIVSDARYRSLRQPITPTYYVVTTSFGSFVLYVRTRMQPESVIRPVQNVLTSIDPTLAFLEVHTLAEEVDDSMASERETAALASIFGVLACLLVGAGLYGLLTYAVTQRRREIGIRMALGAQPVDIWGMIARQSLVMTVGGILLGLSRAFLAARWLEALLYHTSPEDPRLLIVAVLFVAVMVAVSTAIPAARATRIEPSRALRHEE
jgi:predicted permease